VGVNSSHLGPSGKSRFNRSKLKTERAHKLRREATDVERWLWQRLRRAQIDGASFRRQHPAGNYILDFYCPALRLAIELDGGQHATAVQRDRVRDAWLSRQGVTLLRFWNSDVIGNLSGVMEVIAAKISELKMKHTASSSRWTPTPTLPLSGGGSAPSPRRR
jgi:very-short-patch-repair endonuclease